MWVYPLTRVNSGVWEARERQPSVTRDMIRRDVPGVAHVNFDVQTSCTRQMSTGLCVVPDVLITTSIILIQTVLIQLTCGAIKYAHNTM